MGNKSPLRIKPSFFYPPFDKDCSFCRTHSCFMAQFAPRIQEAFMFDSDGTPDSIIKTLHNVDLWGWAPTRVGEAIMSRNRLGLQINVDKSAAWFPLIKIWKLNWRRCWRWLGANSIISFDVSVPFSGGNPDWNESSLFCAAENGGILAHAVRRKADSITVNVLRRAAGLNQMEGDCKDVQLLFTIYNLFCVCKRVF